MTFATGPLLSAFVGAGIGGLLLAGVGQHSGQAVLGASLGSCFGAVLGLGASRGWIHRITVGLLIYAAIGFTIGPGCDDTVGMVGVMGAMFGAFVAWLGWRALWISLGAFLAIPLIGGLFSLTLGVTARGEEISPASITTKSRIIQPGPPGPVDDRLHARELASATWPMPRD